MTLTGPSVHTLPEAVRITLANRGSTTVWDSSNHSDHQPTSAVPALLLHGWNIDAPTNFSSAFTEVARTRRVVMHDHHGHGGGARSPSKFSLESAAADALSVLDALGIPEVIVVGYSMGGAVAQLLARRAPDRVSGLVLMATADRFADHRRERRQFTSFSLGASAMRRLPVTARMRAFNRITAAACRKYPSWILDTVQRADPISLLEAGAAIGRFDSTGWNTTLPQRTAVVVTSRDMVVPPRRQIRLATSLGAVHLESVDAGHDLPILNDPRFSAVMIKSLDAVSI